MNRNSKNSFLMILLRNMTVILFFVIFICFSLLDKRFFTLQNFDNILRSSAFIGIIAVGMTFVLLTGGIDLSVGSVMYITGALTGIMLGNKVNFWLTIAAGLGAGIAVGYINAFFITRLKIIPFMTTLGTMTVGRGVALFISKSRALSFPSSIKFGAVKAFGLIPLPILIFLTVVLVAILILNNTKLGRQIYAFGNDPEAAKKAGLNNIRINSVVYVISGFCAALAAIVAISQQGRVTASFGTGIEFKAIASSVLGGTSLFGGVGQIFPGTFVGTMLLQMIQTGMVYLQVDGYLQDMIVALVIFFAIFIDSRRINMLRKLERRNIRVEKTDGNC